MRNNEQESDTDVSVTLVYVLPFGICSLLPVKVCFILSDHIYYRHRSDRRVIFCVKKMEDQFMRTDDMMVTIVNYKNKTEEMK